MAFYRGPSETLYQFLRDHVIRWTTQGPYTHCELVIGDTAYSSCPEQGVRIKSVDFNINHWDFLTIPKIDPQNILAKFSNELGKPYDFKAMLNFFAKRNVGRSNHWFCSELCAYLLGIEDAWKHSPNSLYQYLSQRYFIQGVHPHYASRTPRY